MVRNSANKRSKFNTTDSENVQVFIEGTKTILGHIQQLTSVLEQLDTRISQVENRMSFLEKNDKSPFAQELLPKLPEVDYSPPSQGTALGRNYTTLSEISQDLQSEISSVMNQGAKLIPVTQAKKEEYKNIQAAVHQEFKNINFKPRRGNNNKTKKLVSVSNQRASKQEFSVSVFKNMLINDLEESFVQILEKFHLE